MLRNEPDKLLACCGGADYRLHGGYFLVVYFHPGNGPEKRASNGSQTQNLSTDREQQSHFLDWSAPCDVISLAYRIRHAAGESGNIDI
jgi:hypothetical protein